ncbi:MAG TPA: CoA-binding protein [Actinomycetota bacterium]|nr:CoA-binding protein [Actinomycetota bacterium]
MSHPDPARKILESYKTFAVVGCSGDPWRASHGVAQFLQSRGYRIVPVTPFEDEILGERCYPDLASIPEEAGVEVADIFRRSDAAGAHVDEAIELGLKAVWLQIGVIDEAAAERARSAGLDVVMDRCPKIEYPRVFAGRERAAAP